MSDRSSSFALQCLAVVCSLGVVFGLPWTEELKYFYLLFLPLTWMSLRQGLEGACLGLAMIQLGLIASAQWLDYKGGTVQEMQFLMASLAITGLTLGVTSSARKVAESELKRALRLAAAAQQRQREAERLIMDDPFVQAMMRDFGGKIVPGTLKADPA